MTLMQDVRPRETVWHDKVSRLVATEQELNLASYVQARHGQAKATRMAAALAAAAVALGVLLSWRIIRGVRRPIEQAIGVAERIATGDLDAGEMMARVVAGVGMVSAIVGEISAACREQACGIEHVNGAVVKLDNSTQQNAALVEQSSAAAESLSHQARLLGELVATFRLAATKGRSDQAGAACSASRPAQAA